jgi:DNA-binding response OmpR family regulator
MTAYDEPATRERSKRAGAIVYLVKPFDGRALVATLRRVSRRD